MPDFRWSKLLKTLRIAFLAPKKGVFEGQKLSIDSKGLIERGNTNGLSRPPKALKIAS